MSQPTTPTELLAQARACLNLARDDAKDAADAMPKGNAAYRAIRHLDRALANLQQLGEAMRQADTLPLQRHGGEPQAVLVDQASGAITPLPVAQLELTGQQVLELARFVIPAWVLDTVEAESLDRDAHQQLDTPVTVAVDPPTAPAGTWAWCSEYPDEGATRLGE